MSRSFRLTFWASLTVIGFLCWVLVVWNNPQRAWVALLAGLTFFLPLSSGLFIWSAIVKASNGSWPGKLERIPLASLGCAIPVTVALIALWIWNSYWEPWSGQKLPQGNWFTVAFVMGRDLTALCGFWILAFFYYKKRIVSNARSLTGWLLILYSVTISIIGFDLIMGLYPSWSSTVFGLYVIVTALYGSAAVWAVITIAGGISSVSQNDKKHTFQFHDRGRLHDISKLIYTFAIMSAYLMFCQLLPLWYENIPHETSFLIPRMNFGPWSMVSAGLLFTIYIGPIVFMLPRNVKRTPLPLAICCIIILGGLWLERLWLVLPSYSINKLSLSDFGVLLIFIGLCALCMEIMSTYVPELSYGD